MIPGLNLLNMATKVISTQTVTYYKFIGREPLPNGVLVNKFAPGVPIKTGSLQAIESKKTYTNGIEFAPLWVEWIVPAAVIGIERNNSGDQIEYKGRRFAVGNIEDWDNQDGWVIATCQEVKPKK